MMLDGSLRDLCSIRELGGARQDYDAGGALSGNRSEGALELGAASRLKHLKLQTQRSRRGLRSFQISGDARLAGVAENGDPRDAGGDLLKKLQTLPNDLGRRHAQSCDVAPGPRETSNETESHRVADESHDNGNRFGRFMRCQSTGSRRRDDDVNVELHELRDHLGKPLVLPVCPPPFDGDVLTLDVSQLAQAFAKGQDGR